MDSWYVLVASAVPGSFACISRHWVERHFGFISLCLPLSCLHNTRLICCNATENLSYHKKKSKKGRSSRLTMDTPGSMQLPGIFSASVTEYLNILTCTTFSAVFPNTGINVFFMFFFFFSFFFLPGCQQRIMCCPCCFCLQQSNFNMPFFLWQNRNRWHS